jgi:hypothetical protein
MDAGLLLQYVVIALAVVASLAYVVRRQFPGSVRRARIACAVPLVREGRAPWLRRVGLWIAPAPRNGGASGDDGCGSCKSCKP